MGRATDPGENHDPGKGQFYTQLDPGAPIRDAVPNLPNLGRTCRESGRSLARQLAAIVTRPALSQGENGLN